ncbi:discoidin, CUB and LCCL domain-containing protein 2 isoform X2 [Monodelphis domestica]|uniref:discoidin, CUB and LCCL domain-containing protein 2 isoform X2 n=1 Tax=Monodelphis domestica TaxID=13616 RepID=UPI000443154E|nr:discoidin, CUB and LCCL domain-containing protein 2 isoform X2 [Monodelphis domestica]
MEIRGLVRTQRSLLSSLPQVWVSVRVPARAAAFFISPSYSSSSSFSTPLFILLVLLLLLEDTGAQQGDGCGHTVLGPESGTFTSINYPHSYPNSTVCEWEIRVKTGERVHIKFGDFDIEDSDSCHFNYLRVYNGIGLSRTEIGKYCGLGLQMNHSIESKSNEMTVLFMSGTHVSGRGFLASYSVINKPDLITCLDTATNFLEPEFSKYCPAGCLIPFAEISGTIPHGYRDSSSLCMAGIHAGVVSNNLGGQISVVISKGIPYYESSLANNVTSVVGQLSASLFTFKTSGCYGTLGMESGVISDFQITSSSVWMDYTEQQNSWKPEKARLKKPGTSWAANDMNKYQWLQIDMNKEKKITGIITTGSTMIEHNYYVSAYRILYSDDAQKWTVYREPGIEQDKVFQGNTDYYQDVRNNFIPPIIARFVRINPVQWQQKIAMKVELLGCQFIPIGRAPKLTQPPFSRNNNEIRNTTFTSYVAKGRAPKFNRPPPRHGITLQTDQTTMTPDIKNTTVTPNLTKDVALAAVLVPVLVMVLTTLILILVCGWHWRNRKKKTEGTYDLPYWDRAEYAQPLVGGIGTLHQRSTFKPEEGKEAGYADLDPYNAPVPEVYHAYAEPLPITGPEYATPIVMDMSAHPAASGAAPSTSTFKAPGNKAPPLVGTYNSLSRTDSGPVARAEYDTPKGGKPGLSAPDETMYQVPQGTLHTAGSKGEVSGAGREGEGDMFKEVL